MSEQNTNINALPVQRTLQKVTLSQPQAGSGILHPFPTGEIPHIDPFVFLDTGAPRQMNGQEIYVGPHPHRGVQPVSLLFKGRIEHRDSLGLHKTVESGGMQWLVAGSGALHEEVLGGDSEGIFHMAQLWINVPAALKMDEPEHHGVTAEAIPLFEIGENTIARLYAGTLNGYTGPAPRPTPVLLAHLKMQADSEVNIPVPKGWTTAIMVVDGGVLSSEQNLQTGATAIYHDDGDSITLASENGGQVLLMCGEPIGEPIEFGGGAVMNTPAEIQQAFADYRSGKMGVLQPSR